MTEPRDARDDYVPFCVEPGWTRGVFVKGLWNEYRVLFYADGTARFEHTCDRGERGVIVCAPRLQLDGGHRITSDDPLTVEPSVRCPDCGLHGFIRAGRWIDA